jgi:ketosteroid isomerase-like protein
MDTRRVATQFATAVEEGRFLDAFGMIAEDGTYTIIGTTQASGTYRGRAEVLGRLIPILSGFIAPPALKFSHILVDGDRAVLLGKGAGVGPTGPYEQPYYAFSLRIGDQEVFEIVEFLDTTMLDTAVFGKMIVDKPAAVADQLGRPARAD